MPGQVQLLRRRARLPTAELVGQAKVFRRRALVNGAGRGGRQGGARGRAQRRRCQTVGGVVIVVAADYARLFLLRLIVGVGLGVRLVGAVGHSH